MPASRATALDLKATQTATPAHPGPDIAACDREPIHIPGAIQPHGLLLVADAKTLSVVAGAGDIEGQLDREWLGAPLARLIGDDAAETAKGLVGMPQSLGQIERGGQRFDILASRSGGRVLVELEPAAPATAAVAVLWTIDLLGGTFEQATDLGELCERAAAAFRQLTGFDRVMIYRFLDDDAGVVVAEDRDPALGSFLNHHFPASDIPRQARQLYIRNRVRVIPSSDYVPAPLRPASSEVAALDLSDVALRSVSPVHVQYLANMGVAASASVSIVKDGVLWGLVACHHRTPKTLAYEARMTCRTLAGGLARQIRAKEEAETYRERIRLRSAEDAVLSRLGAEGFSLTDLFASVGDELNRMLGADGFAAIEGRDIFLAGRCPDPEDVRDIAAWVKTRAVAQPFATRELTSQLAGARLYQDDASGLLAVTMSPGEPVILMWFRAEEVEVVNWAGNPHKAVHLKPGEMLTPRASFEAWSEIVRGRSKAWTLGEIEAASRLKNAIYEVRQTRRVRDLNRELTATIADKESLLVQKDFLIKEVNHRVQNSLQLVAAFLALQSRAVGDATLTGHLDEAQRRLSAVALVHRRLYGDELVETVDLARYIEDLCADLRSSMGPEWSEKLAADLSPILISADRAVNVGLILTELVINAQKYAYDGRVGPISISLEQHRNRFRLVVADRGSGKSKTRQGFGTRMLNAMIDRLGGTLEETSGEPGLRVIVTAPLQPV